MCAIAEGAGEADRPATRFHPDSSGRIHSAIEMGDHERWKSWSSKFTNTNFETRLAYRLGRGLVRVDAYMVMGDGASMMLGAIILARYLSCSAKWSAF